MRPLLFRAQQRCTLRRQVLAPCQVVDEDAFTLVGDMVFDLSLEGMCVRCVHPVSVGSAVIASFRIPSSSFYCDTEAVVARILWGRRDEDTFPALGLHFTHMEAMEREVLRARLQGMPPPVPRRHLRMDYAASVYAIHHDLPLAA